METPHHCQHGFSSSSGSSPGVHRFLAGFSDSAWIRHAGRLAQPNSPEQRRELWTFPSWGRLPRPARASGDKSSCQGWGQLHQLTFLTSCRACVCINTQARGTFPSSHPNDSVSQHCNKGTRCAFRLTIHMPISRHVVPSPAAYFTTLYLPPPAPPVPCVPLR